VGSTIGATILGLSLPVTVEFMTSNEAQSYYQQGFQIASLAVVWIIVAGGIVSLFQKVPAVRRQREPEPELAPQPGGDD
jgi:flagellar biosynthesis/type III secretory pathway M-ring protein FliF/YscJ